MEAPKMLLFGYKTRKVTTLSCVIVQLRTRSASESSALKHRVECAQMLGYGKSARHTQALPHSYAKRAKEEFLMYAAPSQ